MIRDSKYEITFHQAQAPLSIFDSILLWILRSYGLLTFVALALVPLRFLPAEDAVILFQYSRNLAEHGAIRFLATGAHVEGATDFGWMALIASAMRCGIPPFWFCAIVNAFCLIVLAMLLLRLAKLRCSLSRVFAVAGATALFPQIFAAAAGFAVLPDAVLLTLLVLFVTRCKVVSAAVCALILCLFRPDGVLFALPLLFHLLLRQKKRCKRFIEIGAFFVLPGLLYFFLRWHYFGEFFPLPFLVKSDTYRSLGLFVDHSVRESFPYLVFVAIVLAPLYRVKHVQRLWLTIPLIALPTAFYWSMRLDQNIGARFFYYLPLAAAIMLAVNWVLLRRYRLLILRTAFLAWLIVLAMPLYRELRSFRDAQFNAVENIAKQLDRLPQHGTLLTSEAGFLPYFSEWKTYDAWGLNTPEFAHRFFQRSDVARLGADLIVMHPDRTESCLVQQDWMPDYTERTWQHMTRNMIEGADPMKYELWLTTYGSEFYRQRKHWKYGEGDRECWFVRKNSPLYAGIVQALRDNHGVAPAEAVQMEKSHGR